MTRAAPPAPDLPGQDPVLAALARALLITMTEEDASRTPRFIAQLLQALKRHLDDQYGDGEPMRPT